MTRKAIENLEQLPGYPNYACSSDGALYSKARGDWKRLSDVSRVISIRNEARVTTITRQKFKYCARFRINPDDVDGRKYLITPDCQVTDPSERSRKNNKAHSDKQRIMARAKLMSTLDFTQACLDYIDGKVDSLLLLAYDVTPFVRAMLNRYSLNRDFQAAVIDEAKSQFLDALDRGAVTNPRDWIYARCRGLAVERKHKCRRIKDYEG